MKKSFDNLLVRLAIPLAITATASAQTPTPTSQMERLTRGVVAMHKPSGGNFISWRMLGTEPTSIKFDVLRDGKVISADQALTSYEDISGTTTSQYQIVAKINGEEIETSVPTNTWGNVFKRIKLQRPKGGFFVEKSKVTGKDSIAPYSYYPHDCSAADLDGDGEYEIVVKWNPTNAKDNSSDGYTGACILDAYKIDFNTRDDITAKRLWHIDLGKNIRSGSHYTQFLVYDFDGDGKAEIICKTAPSSVDGKGQFVSSAADDAAIFTTDNTADYRTAAGRIMSGPEYLTVFNGETGEAIHTIWYNPNRGGEATGEAIYPKDFWGDEYGNRGERFLACVAYLQGADKTPSAVMCRGYYTKAYVWAVNFDGSKLSTLWRHLSLSKTITQVTDALGKTTTKVYNKNTSGIGSYYTAYGQGNHNISVADVDGDGCDEVIFGSATIDNDGKLLYTTGLCHGDAMHVGDLLPDRPGLEVFTVHEYKPYGFDVHDAATGEIIHHVTGKTDTGRGMTGDINMSKRGYEFWSSNSYNVYDSELNVISSDATHRPPYSHRVYWNGEARDVMLDGVNIYYNEANSKSVRLADIAANTACPGGTKAYPCLSADLFGDWREEIILFDKSDSASFVVFSSAEPTKISVPTLMHDHVYRMGIAWQNVAYNQPPHIGYFLPDSVGARIVYDKTLRSQTVILGDEIKTIEGSLLRGSKLSVGRTLLNGKIKNYTGLWNNSGLDFSYDNATGKWSLGGKPKETGLLQIVLNVAGDPTGLNRPDTLSINVSALTDIKDMTFIKANQHDKYNLNGQKVSDDYKGIVIRGKRKYIKQ